MGNRGTRSVPKSGPLSGVFQGNQRGFGFVLTPDGDVYVSARDAGGAMHGDTVEVGMRPSRGREPGPRGEVLRVITRGARELVGVFERRGKVRYVVPSDRRFIHPVLIHHKDTGGAFDGQLVSVEITRYPTRHEPCLGRVIDILGDEEDPSVQVEAVVREHNLRTEFPAEVVAEASAAPDSVSADQVAGRRDFREDFVVTIDGLDAKDFDDAVSVRRISGSSGSGEDAASAGCFELDVHIADVSSYVPLGSALELEARERSTSVYLSDRVLPMLPQRLSNGICSLNPDVERLSLSVQMQIDALGEVTGSWIGEGIIRSHARLTYEQVDAGFDGRIAWPDARTGEMMELMRELSDALEAKRLRRGSLEFETAEAKILTGDDGCPIDVLLRERTAATKIIEEAMIVTNETVAAFMLGKDRPSVYRIHDKPEAEALTSVERLIEELGYPVPPLDPDDQRTLQRLIEFLHPRPERLLVNMLLLRAMKQARYVDACAPHYGLASTCYTHFTSPIRRYPDLVLHHLVKAELIHADSGPFPPRVDELRAELADLMEHASKREREADDAERESTDVMLCYLMKDRVGEEFDAVISGVVGSGFFAQLENTAEGLVHRGSLDDDEYVCIPESYCLKGQRTGRVYRLGQKVRVRLVRVSVGERRIDFVLADQ